jgi:uncharacterized membrane protein
MDTCRNTSSDLPRLDPGVELRFSTLERRIVERQEAFERALWWKLESRLYGVIISAVAVISIAYLVWSWKGGQMR